MENTTRSNKARAFGALALLVALTLASSCKSPLLGLGGIVDIAVPGVTVSEVEEGGTPRELVNGDYVRGTIIIRGRASDDIGIVSVVLTFTENGATVATAATVDMAAQTWSASIDTTAYIDGDKDFTVTVTDTAEKNTTSRFVLYFDNKPPTVLLTVPADDEGNAVNALYGVIDIKGSVADQFGVRKVRVYVYRASDGVLLYSSPDDASIGTNSFALQLDTSALLGKTGSERGYVYVRAWDRSGNTNAQFYRLGDIKALNANQGATVEELHALENGSSTLVNDLTLATIASTRRYEPGTGYEDTQLVSCYFDQSSNLPMITISNPEENKTAEQNILSRSAKASGLVEDANGVASVEVQFRLLNASETVWFSDVDTSNSGDVIDVSGTGRVVNWNTKSLVESAAYGLSVGVQGMRVRATDSDGNSITSDWVPFTIDADAPVVEITSPTPGAYAAGDPIVISGTAESYGTATVSKVELTVVGKFDYVPATITSGNGTATAGWSFSITPAELAADGLYTVKARITDTAGKEAFNNIVITIDRTAPSGLSFISPKSASSVNGYPVLMGQANDNVLLKEVYLAFEKNSEEILLADTYNWSYELDAGTLANTTYGYDMGNNIFRVPFQIRAIDQAGNSATSPSFGTVPASPGAGSYYLDVDLDGDKPEITNIVSPGEENTTATPYLITGSIKFQGTATDDDGLYRVEMALIALVGTTENWRSLDGATAAASETYYPVNGTTLWNQVLNDDGALYALADLVGHTGDFKIIVRAVDTKDGLTADVTGNGKTIYVRFDNTLPGVIDLDPEEGSMQRDTFALSFTAQDNNSIILAQVSYNNGTNYTTLALSPSASIPLTVSVNTKTVNSNAFATSSGTLYMRIRLKDDALNITEKSFKYLVDNIAPINVTPPSSATMSAISDQMYTEAGASLAEILGVVNDTGTIRGINRVEVYFERAGQIYRLNPDLAASTMASANRAFSNGTFLYPDMAVPGYENYVLTVDKAENYSDAVIGGGDGDGYQESISQGTSGYTWGARFDSSKIQDGDVTVHYVAWDEAGNSSHFQVAGVVRNNPPELETITLGTDLNSDADSVDDGERVKLIRQADGSWRGYTLNNLDAQLGTERAYDLALPILTVRNSRFTFAAMVDGGNLPLQYRAMAPNGSTTLLDWSGSSTYTEISFATGGWMEDSINALTVQARDSAFGASLFTENLTFRVKVDNADATAPLLSIAPVGRRFADPTTGQSLSYGSRDESDVSYYSDNVHWIDSDSSGVCSWEERLGHVELPADSLYGGPDADVSGIIKLRGKVYDDQRVSRMTVAFSTDFDTNGTTAGGITPAGTEIDIAQFSEGSLSVLAARTVAQDAAVNTLSFGLSGRNTPELSDELGHTMSYELTWNTAFISEVAGNDVTVTFRAYNADGSFSATSPLTVDVVPYITGISTSLDTALGADYNRSATGKYAVRIKSTATAEYETITINGFNLNPLILIAGATSDIRLSVDKDGFDASYSTKQGTGLPGSSVASDYRSLNASIQATGSGYITVITNGIPSINNINSATSYNIEDALIQVTLKDDRYLSLWDFTPLRDNISAPNAKNAIYPSMAMAGNTPQFTYVNNSGGYGIAEFWSGSSEIKIYENWDLFTFSALALNDDDGRAALFDINIVQSGTDFIGDKGGITVNMIYDPPATTWNGTTYYYRDYNIWLDNLYKSGNLAVLGRYQYPTISLVGTNALSHAFYSVYDSIDDRVIFRYFRVGTSQTDVGGGNSTNATSVTDSGTTNLYVNNIDLVQRNQNNTWPVYTDNATNNTRLGQNNDSGNTNAGQYFAAGTGAGLHTAVAGVSTGALTARAMLVYYTANNLYYMFATNDGNTAWSAPLVLDSNVGAEYVSMVVDNDTHVHIAYQDSFAGDVKYVYIPTYTDPSTRKTVVVDSYLTVGSKLTLAVPKGLNTPYLSYKGLGNTAKIAWYNSVPAVATLSDGVNSSDRFTGSWEVQILPTVIVDSDSNRFNVGIGTDEKPVVGYANNKAGLQGIEYLTGLPELVN